MNKFGDMSSEDFARVYNGYKMTAKNSTRIHKPSGSKVPDSIDWRTQGYVTGVKDQGQCGSCWAFSAVAALEGANFMVSGSLSVLSEQNLLDCSGQQGNHGCNGGQMDNAFRYVEAKGGIDLEMGYPYTAKV